jgi:ketosteroid isomerase-like protein
MSLENKALVRRFYEEIDKGNVEAMDELVAETTLIIRRRLSLGWHPAAMASNKASGCSGPPPRATIGSRIRSQKATKS